MINDEKIDSILDELCNVSMNYINLYESTIRTMTLIEYDVQGNEKHIKRLEDLIKECDESVQQHKLLKRKYQSMIKLLENSDGK